MPADRDPPTFERTVPARSKSALLSLAAFGIASVPLILGDPPGLVRYVWIFLSGLSAFFGAICLIAAIAPDAYLLGVAPSADGFELRRPLRRPKVIRFDEIRRIEVVAGIYGERGDTLGWRVHTRSGMVRLTENMVHGSQLFELLVARIPIDRTALGMASRYEPRGLEHLWGKRFVLYEKRLQ